MATCGDSFSLSCTSHTNFETGNASAPVAISLVGPEIRLNVHGLLGVGEAISTSIILIGNSVEKRTNLPQRSSVNFTFNPQEILTCSRAGEFVNEELDSYASALSQATHALCAISHSLSAFNLKSFSLLASPSAPSPHHE